MPRSYFRDSHIPPKILRHLWSFRGVWFNSKSSVKWWSCVVSIPPGPLHGFESVSGAFSRVSELFEGFQGRYMDFGDFHLRYMGLRGFGGFTMGFKGITGGFRRFYRDIWSILAGFKGISRVLGGISGGFQSIIIGVSGVMRGFEGKFLGFRFFLELKVIRMGFWSISETIHGVLEDFQRVSEALKVLAEAFLKNSERFKISRLQMVW